MEGETIARKMEKPNPGRVLVSEESSGPNETPPSPDKKSSKETAESSPADSPAPAQKSPSPSQEQGSPPPESSKANPPPKSPSSSSPPASSPPASSTTSPPSSSSSSPPPPASPPPENSGGSSKHPPASHPPPPNESPKSTTPPPPVSKSSPSHPPPASPPPPSSSDTPVISPPSDSSDTSTPPPPATNASPPPPAKKSASPPAEKTSPPSAEGPSKTVPTPPHASSSPPAASTKTPTSSNVPPPKSTTPSSQTPDHVPKLSPPSAKSTSDSSTSSQEGPIIGFTVAGVVIIAFFIFFCVARRRRKRQEAFLAQYKPTANNFSGQPDGYYYQSHQYTGGSPGQADTYFAGKPMATPGHVNGYANNGVYSPGAPDANVMGAKSSFSYEELMEITNGFSRNNILGEGGFGCVYKGWLPDGRLVAVKQLKAGSGQGEREFQAEVEIISRVHHRHLVSLVGYCIAERHRLLVYEFVPNNTLEHHLHGKGVPVMEWSQRVKIAIGAARGLAYLHEDCHPKIIHRDIKSANILLDDDFEAQVADFGLAKLTNDTSTHVSTRVMGTFGYMAPEYASSGKLTDRSDVYSFGVVLLELVTGRKPVDATQPLGDESLVEWARPFLNHAIESCDFEEIADSRLECRYVESEMLRMIETAAACVRHSAQKRPRMSQVVRALDTEGEIGDLTNGVKVGQSTIFEANKRSADMQQFRRLALGGDSTEFSLYSGESNSREVPLKSKSSWSDDSSEYSSAGKLMA